MRLSVSITVALLLAGTACAQPRPADAQAGAPVAFEIEPSGKAGHVELEISRRSGNSHWIMGRDIATSALQGLAADSLSGKGGPVSFSLVREAGTLACEGVARRGRATGDCSFAPDPQFASALAARGIGAPSAQEQFSLALNDIGLAYVAELERQRYDTPTASDLGRAGDHGVTLDYLKEMGAQGYRVGRLPALIQMRDHGVTPDLIAGLTAHNVRDIPAEDIVRLRDHGITPDYVGRFREMGYRDLPIETLIRLRDHGVSPEFASAIRSNGYGRFTADEIIRMRIHGVDSDYVGALKALGYMDISAEDFVRMRIHGVDPAFIRRANSGARHTPEELVRLRIGG